MLKPLVLSPESCYNEAKEGITEMPEQLVSTGEAAEALGLTRRAVSLLVKEGKLPAQQTPGGQYRIARRDLEAFLSAPPVVNGTTLAIAHHAGGVGKTTTTSNLAYALAQAGQRVCVVDLDPQGDFSVRLGIVPVAPTLAEALLVPHGVPPLAQRCEWNGVGFDVIASDLATMAGTELALMTLLSGREQRLRRVLAPLRPSYDYLLLDCPPSLSLLMVNALHAADGVIIPVQAEDKAVRQIEQVFKTLDDVNDYRDLENPVRVFGLLLTMVDRRAGMAGEVESALRAAYGDLVFGTTIPRRVDASADSRYQAPLGVYAPNNAAARAHAALAQEVISRA
jgi:chromosome partitioning protein